MIAAHHRRCDVGLDGARQRAQPAQGAARSWAAKHWWRAGGNQTHAQAFSTGKLVRYSLLCALEMLANPLRLLRCQGRCWIEARLTGGRAREAWWRSPAPGLGAAVHRKALMEDESERNGP